MTTQPEPRFQTAGTETETVIKFRMEPINPRKRIVIQDQTGAYYKIAYIRIRIKLQTAFKPTGSANYYGIRINPETGAHLDSQVIHFQPDPNQVTGIQEEIEQFIRQKLKGQKSAT